MSKELTTKQVMQLKQVIATMEIENMHVSDDMIENMKKILIGEKTEEQAIQEIIEKYKK